MGYKSKIDRLAMAGRAVPASLRAAYDQLASLTEKNIADMTTLI